MTIAMIAKTSKRWISAPIEYIINPITHPTMKIIARMIKNVRIVIYFSGLIKKVVTIFIVTIPKKTIIMPAKKK